MIHCFLLMADMPSPTREELSSFIVTIVGVLGGLYFLTAIVANVKKTLERTPKVDDMYVTELKFQEQLKLTKDELTGKLSKVEISLAECSTKTEVKELREYTSKSVHEIRNDINPISLKIEAVTIMMNVLKEQLGEVTRLFRECNSQNSQQLQIISSNKDAMDRVHIFLADLRVNGNTNRGSKGQ